MINQLKSNRIKYPIISLVITACNVNNQMISFIDVNKVKMVIDERVCVAADELTIRLFGEW